MAKNQKIMEAGERRELILDTGAKLGAKHGLANVTRRMVAAQLGVTDPLVSHYVGDNAAATKAYRKRMKELGLVEPAADKIEEIGIKLRKRSFSRATPNKPAAKPKAKPKVKQATPQPAAGKKAPTKPKAKSAAPAPKSKKPAAPASSKPKAMPELPPLPKPKFAPKAPPVESATA